MRSLYFLVMVFTLVFSGNAEAAGLSSSAKNIDPVQAWNPRPEADDIILPMPCDSQMVFRAVDVPGKGVLYDRKFSMGVNNSSSERDLYERRFEGYISAPFTARDLPLKWQETLKASATGNDFYYFIAKYEISVRQWRVVMEDACPTSPPTEAELRPKTDISWYEMQQFFSRYMEWLIKNNKQSLPIFADNDKDIGYLRLPTEEEWEFAARGGMRVPEEGRNQEDFYPLKEYSSIKKDAPASELALGDFAVFQSSDRTNSAPLPIGSRKANPLLLYDMGGNAKELVQSLFQFSVPEERRGETTRRLHGSSGGFVCKGGSFLTGAESILPGWRAETPLFQENGKYAMRDLGFRPVLSGINTPASASKTAQLEKENLNMSQQQALAPTPVAPTPAVKEKDAPVKINTTGSLLSELDKIIDSTASPTVRENLGKYRSMVTDNLSASSRRREEIILDATRSALFQAELIVSMAYRLRKTTTDTKEAQKKLTELVKIDKAAASQLQSQLTTADAFMKELRVILGNCVNKYKQDLENLTKESPENLERQFAVLRMEYGSGDLLGKHMRQNLEALQKHLAQVRQKGIGSLSREQIEKDIIPEVLRKE